MKTPKATAFGSFGYGWQQLWKYFLHLFLIGIVVVVASMPGERLRSAANTCSQHAGFVVLNVLVAVYALLVLPVVTYGSDWMYLRFMRDERANVADVFMGFKKNYLNIILANLLVFAICGIGFVVFVIPGNHLRVPLGVRALPRHGQGARPRRGHREELDHDARPRLADLRHVRAVDPVGLRRLHAGCSSARSSRFMWIGCAFASLYHAVDLEDQALLNRNGAT